MIRQIENPAEKKSIASQILYFLPEWLGIPESTAQYIEDSLSRPFFHLLGLDDHDFAPIFKCGRPHKIDVLGKDDAASAVVVHQFKAPCL